MLSSLLYDVYRNTIRSGRYNLTGRGGILWYAEYHLNRYEENELLGSGELLTIIWEFRNGSFWTFLDEVWHAPIFDWIFPGLHFRFCQWAHNRLYEAEVECRDEKE